MSLLGLGKQARLGGDPRDRGAERSEYQMLPIEGNSMVKHEVIARYVSAQAQAEALPLSSLLDNVSST
jgi:hypothetical protein